LFNELLQKVSACYFKPRPIELRNQGKIYECLGVRFFKKWVPTSGEVVTRLRGINRLKITETGSRRKALEIFELQTRKWEWRHLISAIFLFIWAIIGGLYFDIKHFYIPIIINVFVNLYPILVQRYNRVRIIVLLGKVA
jgi:hypothetical protein